MTDPKVKQALLDLCDVMRKLTAFAESINQRVYKAERKIEILGKIEARRQRSKQ